METSVIAGKAIAELANELPNSGGVAGFFAGDNDIDTFGKQLLIFGQSIKEYCNTVNGMDTSGVDESLNAGKKILELTGTLSDNGLNAVNFCEGMKTIAKSFVDFSNKISNINISDVSSIIDNFKSSLSELGTVGVDGLVTSFTNAGTQISQVTSKIIN